MIYVKLKLFTIIMQNGFCDIFLQTTNYKKRVNYEPRQMKETFQEKILFIFD